MAFFRNWKRVAPPPTAREVISRQLNDLEGRRLVSLSRGGIRLLGRDGLTRLEDGH